ncbi:hypothetical protein ROSEINA2194_04471 [Roseburia inulinivorans DSM 16841]|uniref:Uncharacterized protein n=1 Tax=Roseburia inulinivorans DSM 16841 TaxID=622312 RepID=C0G0C1_9FIRM|nr:hypothetical protein ROSEINA2194_04471 [Roseburia inulinivorans DSM 16841]
MRFPPCPVRCFFLYTEQLVFFFLAFILESCSWKVKFHAKKHRNIQKINKNQPADLLPIA